MTVLLRLGTLRASPRREVAVGVDCLDFTNSFHLVHSHGAGALALTTARERGCDLVDIQTFAGHSDPKTTLSYIRNRDRLDKSPAYVLTYGNPEITTAT